MLLYLKYIIEEAVAGKSLAYLGGKAVGELESVPRIFGEDNEAYQCSSIIIVPQPCPCLGASNSGFNLADWARANQPLLEIPAYSQ